MLYPLTFQPLFMERVWGGRRLESLYQKPLPPGVPIGESWEVTDRPEGVSVITNGPLAGRDLRWLMEHHAEELLGSSRACQGRFPLLVKILDAQDKLSLQVHPPARRAAGLGGEPKTEMWYVAAADPGADIYVGLQRGVGREEFERRIGDGSVAQCFHRIEVKTGDVMFLPSGRVHALGAGSVIFEIQQNSDTTYRVFDWNRTGLDGRPRALHIPQAMASIDFEDFEPALVADDWHGSPLRTRSLAQHELFSASLLEIPAGSEVELADARVQVWAMVEGAGVATDGTTEASLKPGDFCVLPAALERKCFRATTESRLLVAFAN